MEAQNGEISVTVKAKSIPELVDKLKKVLGQYEVTQPIQQVEPPEQVDFPDDIKKIYPDYMDHQHSAAMLSVLREKHRGKANAVESLDLAKEMMQMFPRLFLGKTEGEVSAANVFSGNFLKKRGLINIEVRSDKGWDYRVYWVD